MILRNINITRDQCSQWQQLAAIPTEEFEEALTQSGAAPNTEGMILGYRAKKPPPTKPIDPDAVDKIEVTLAGKIDDAALTATLWILGYRDSLWTSSNTDPAGSVQMDLTPTRRQDHEKHNPDRKQT